MVTIKDININNKIVLIRCDLNVPIKENKILDNTRIKKSIKTIEYALKNAKKVIILSHLGRIKTEEDLKNNSLRIVCDEMKKLLNIDIAFATYNDNINSIIDSNKVIMFENTRYFDLDNKKESNNDDELCRYFSSFGEVFINDAFGTLHREAASNQISKYLPSAIGFLVEEEINKLGILFDPDRPFSIIMGGSKVSDKIGVISSLIDKCDSLLIAGAMAFTFLKANGYNIGNSICEEDYIDYAKELLDKYNDKIVLPIDVYISDDINSNNKELVDIDNISMIGLDIGPKTIDLFKERLKGSKTVFVNGPMGAYENPVFSYGTKEILEFLNNLDTKVIIGGGDSASAVEKLIIDNNFYHISTGGGASLEFLEGKELPGLKFIGVKNEEV